MKNKITSLKMCWLIFLTALFVVSLSSCTVVQRYKVRHDNGLHKGWYKNGNMGQSPHYKFEQKGPKQKKAKGRR